jgi:hypothetical protein
MSNDDTRDIAIRIVDKMVNERLIIDCTDTENEIEFDIQDIIHEELNKLFKIKED